MNSLVLVLYRQYLAYTVCILLHLNILYLAFLKNKMFNRINSFYFRYASQKDADVINIPCLSLPALPFQRGAMCCSQPDHSSLGSDHLGG